MATKASKKKNPASRRQRRLKVVAAAGLPQILDTVWGTLPQTKAEEAPAGERLKRDYKLPGRIVFPSAVVWERVSARCTEAGLEASPALRAFVGSLPVEREALRGGLTAPQREVVEEVEAQAAADGEAARGYHFPWGAAVVAADRGRPASVERDPQPGSVRWDLVGDRCLVRAQERGVPFVLLRRFALWWFATELAGNPRAMVALGQGYAMVSITILHALGEQERAREYLARKVCVVAMGAFERRIERYLKHHAPSVALEDVVRAGAMPLLRMLNRRHRGLARSLPPPAPANAKVGLGVYLTRAYVLEAEFRKGAGAIEW